VNLMYQIMLLISSTALFLSKIWNSVHLRMAFHNLRVLHTDVIKI
jgi:hypothetical protein